MSIWDILGIKETKDKAQIQIAYREKLAVTNPEDHPQEFMELRSALEAAMKVAEQRGSPHVDVLETNNEDDLVALWIGKVD